MGESILIHRRLHGLQPEVIETEDIGGNQPAASEQEEHKVKIIREFKESYDTADFSGITFPIRVDGCYHGCGASRCLLMCQFCRPGSCKTKWYPLGG